MSGVNKVIILGSLGKDPEVRYSAAGGAICSFSVATSEHWTDKNSGEKQEKTEWHNITVFGKLAELCGGLAKGKKVYLEGKLSTDKYTGKDGVEKYTTKIIADKIEFLSPRDAESPKPTQQRPAQAPQRPAQRQKPSAPAENFDDEIPF